MLQLLEDLDELLASNSNYMMGLWIQDALMWGQNAGEKNLYNFNARNQVTLWGPTGTIQEILGNQYNVIHTTCRADQ
jgi:alpha-N-acetylglucosaminidase